MDLEAGCTSCSLDYNCPRKEKQVLGSFDVLFQALQTACLEHDTDLEARAGQLKENYG